MGYTKLFNELVMSTVWREPDHVRILWITMLALKDRYHKVEASLPGLADAARISIEQCQDALARLAKPDPYSRTKENDGRRIIEIDGGWEILNGEKYRNKMGQDERREYNRLKQREYRAKAKAERESCTEHVQKGTKSADTEADTDAEALKEHTSSSDAAAGAQTPACPHQEIIDLYHTNCPDLPRVRIWEGQRKQNLRQRFMTAPNLEWWEWFFQRINEEDFYNGRIPGKTWRCNLDWIVKHSNFQKLVDKVNERTAA